MITEKMTELMQRFTASPEGRRLATEQREEDRAAREALVIQRATVLAAQEQTAELANGREAASAALAARARADWVAAEESHRALVGESRRAMAALDRRRAVIERELRSTASPQLAEFIDAAWRRIEALRGQTPPKIHSREWNRFEARWEPRSILDLPPLRAQIARIRQTITEAEAAMLEVQSEEALAAQLTAWRALLTAGVTEHVA